MVGGEINALLTMGETGVKMLAAELCSEPASKSRDKDEALIDILRGHPSGRAFAVATPPSPRLIVGCTKRPREYFSLFAAFPQASGSYHEPLFLSILDAEALVFRRSAHGTSRKCRSPV